MAHAIARLLAVPVCLACAASAQGQLIYVPDDWANRVAIFDATTGEYKYDLNDFMYASWLFSPHGLRVLAHDVLVATY